MADGPKPPRRRFLMFTVGLVLAVLIYGIAFERVGVDLDEIQSETRQQQLFGIIRNLFNPELTTYDRVDETVGVDVAIPCGPDVEGTTTTDAGTVTIEPACGNPGDTVTISGSGFPAEAGGRIVFVPESDVAGLFLPLVQSIITSSEGTLEYEVELPDRENANPQPIEVRISTPQGSWGDRVEVWTDTNENGVRDEGVLTEGTLSVTHELLTVPEVPAIALLDPVGQVEQFVTAGGPIEATGGQALGQSAIPLAELADDQIGVYVTGLELQDENLVVDLAGPNGSDISAWRMAIYDGATGQVLETAPLGDQIQLSPRISQTTRDTVDKIIDTVFLALVATTIGLIVAIPLSFLSARNLMKDISTPTINLGLSLIALPVGAYLGVLLVRLIRQILEPTGDSALLALVIGVILGGAVVAVTRSAFSRMPERSVGRTGLAILAGVLALAAFDRIGAAFALLGSTARQYLGRLDFVAGLVATLGEIVVVILPIFGAIAGAAVLVHLASKLGYRLRASLPDGPRKALALLSTVVAGGLWAALVGAAISWMYQLDNPVATLWIPLLVGGLIGLYIGLRGLASGEVRTGLTVYYVSRTIFNTLRSIEPLVMVIVFVVWVGFGEFAGSLALALHTAAALAKLYSEQVESIQPGPMEAVRATGATRLQSIVYAVIPQIVPPYISFTMYRWDINVRMSTILGFAGGGGIGFVLQQNVNLGRYRAAAVQMLAIAIVVATMDWASARLRERLI